MIKAQYGRTAMLIGEPAVEKLQRSRVLVFGLGGVGSFTVEALARAGVGAIGIADFDLVDITNLNRQIIALHTTVGHLKTDAMAERVAQIDPDTEIIRFPVKVTEETIDGFDFSGWDYIVDAVDDVSAKLLIIERAYGSGRPVISSMGTGNKMDPSKFQINVIEKTHTCPLARKMRKELSLRGIRKVKVLFSTETPGRTDENRHPPASISFVPGSAGLLIASEVVKDLIL